MSTPRATESSKHPLGGASGDWRHRLLCFHVPLALTSALVLILFMTLPAFDASTYPHADLRSEMVPRARGERGPMHHGDGGHAGHGGRRSGETDHHAGRTRGMDHHGGPGGAMDHGGHRTLRMDHGSGPAERMDHSGNPSRDQIRRHRFFMRQLTFGTGYVALGLLALTLLIGPANLLLRRRNPVSNYLRRDVGTWTAGFSVVHVIFGLQVHGSGRISGFLTYFVAPDGSLWTNSFGLANWTGLAATVIVMGLLALSSDLALRKLKAKPWKWLQRLNYVLFALVTAHAYFYGALLRMTSPFTLLLGLTLIAVFVGQAVGVWLWRRKYALAAATVADSK